MSGCMEDTLWLHRKSGHLYLWKGLTMIEATGEQAVMYRRFLAPVGDPFIYTLWIRPAREFYDGRFEQVHSVDIS